LICSAAGVLRSSARAQPNTVSGRPRSWKARMMRQKPTRLPYSCHAQLPTSGNRTCPCGGIRRRRGIGRVMSQTSTLTMVQTAMRAPLGKDHRGRPAMGE